MPAISVSENSTWRTSVNSQATADSGYSHWQTVGEWGRHFGKIRYRLKQRLEIYEQIADQAVGQVAVQMRVFLDERAEVKGVIVERVDQAAHGFDPAADVRTVVLKTGR